MTESERKCGYKPCTKMGKHLCSGCGEEIYCSKECQKSAWPAHKPACKMAVKPEAAAFLKSLDSLSAKQLKNVMKAKAATFENKKRTITLARLEKIVEKPSLVKFVQEYVSPSEVESLLSAPPPSKDTGVASSSSSGSRAKSTSSSSSSSSSSRSGRRGITRNNHLPTPTPEQLRQQASMMRKNPGMVRKANPAFAKMTDAQIRQYADQLEQAANNPDMMKEVARMSQLSDSERTQLQRIQEGLSGAVPMDSQWMDETVQALKTHPQMFKSMVQGKGAMMGGISDEQIGSFIDMLSRMDAWLLKFIFQSLQFLGSLYKPLTDVYNTVDAYTFGGGRYIALALFAVLVYYSSIVTWAVLRWVFAKLMLVYTAVYALVVGGSSSAPAVASSVTSSTGAGAAAGMGAVGLGSASQHAASTAAAAAAAAGGGMGSVVLEDTLKATAAAAAAATAGSAAAAGMMTDGTTGDAGAAAGTTAQSQRSSSDAESVDSEFEF